MISQRMVVQDGLEIDILAKALPKETVSEYDNFEKDISENYNLANSRYKTRVRKNYTNQVGYCRND